MKNWKKLTLGATALTAVTVLAACSSGSSNSSSSGGSTSAALQWNLTTPLNTIDSGIATDTYTNEIIGNIQSGATRVDKNGDAANELAKAISVSSDGKTYTVDLKSGLKWSNGDALTAKDFVYAWQRNADPKTASQYAYLLEAVKNGAAVDSGKMDKSQLGIKATSDTQFVVTLENPTPYFKFLLAQSVYFPLDQKVVEKYGKQYATSSDKLVFSGPYMFKSTNSWNGSNNNFSIYKNPGYYDASAVKMNEIDFQVVQDNNTAASLFEQGKLDQTAVGVGTTALWPKYKNNKNVVMEKEATTAYMEYNQSGKGATSADAQKALANTKIRQAFNLGTDREGLVKSVVPVSKAATGITPAGMSKTASGEDFASYAKQGYSYDASKAATLFKEGLKEVGLSKLTVTLTTDDTPAAKQSGTYLQQSLQKALPGLTLNIKTEPFKQRLNDSQNGNFDLVLALWGGDYADPSTFLDLFKTGGPQNDGKFSNAAFDAATKQAETTDAVTPAKRDADYKAAEATLFENSNVNPLYFRTLAVLQNQKLSGVRFGATGLVYDFKYAEKAK
ncbi:MAG: peptide ABC transporter substrate-binding protein [Streptococcaceae bacterium]|jgi:oligopeptide transport system substrate-binding protein|nr:peptide ABC transporter substrate-binding protein [Streptococcaceae bacterium]